MKALFLMLVLVIAAGLLVGCGQKQPEAPLSSGPPETVTQPEPAQPDIAPAPAPANTAVPEVKPEPTKVAPEPAKPVPKPAPQVPSSAKEPVAGPAAKPAGLIVQGTIAAIGETPEPGSVPYKDCLIGVWLKQAKATSGKLDGDQALVFVWGLKDNQRTAAASWSAGRQVTLTLTPWAKAEAEYGGYNRVELDDEATWTLPTFFGRP